MELLLDDDRKACIGGGRSPIVIAPVWKVVRTRRSSFRKQRPSLVENENGRGRGEGGGDAGGGKEKRGEGGAGVGGVKQCA